MINEDLQAMGTREAYNTLKSAIAEKTVDPIKARDILNKVRSGIKLEMDIRIYLKGYLTYVPKINCYFLNGKYYSFSDIENEIEDREILIKEFLYENIGDSSVI